MFFDGSSDMSNRDQLMAAFAIFDAAPESVQESAKHAAAMPWLRDLCLKFVRRLPGMVQNHIEEFGLDSYESEEEVNHDLTVIFLTTLMLGCIAGVRAALAAARSCGDLDEMLCNLQRLNDEIPDFSSMDSNDINRALGIDQLPGEIDDDSI
jgi:hypothetical protein